MRFATIQRVKIGKTYEVLVYFAQTTKASADSLAGILRYASAIRDWRLWLFDPLSHISCGSVLPQRRVDGVIAGDDIEALPESILPGNRHALVSVSGENRRRDVSTVLCDNAEVARGAALFFLARKFRNFAFVESPRRESVSEERLNAFADAIRPACDSFSAKSADDPGFTEWLKRLPRPCALFAANDRFAKVAADTCRISGIHVPEEIAIIGVDDEEMICNFTSPTLTSIRPAFENGGYMAAKLLDELMRGKMRKARRLRYGVDGIIERDSTAISTTAISAPSALEAFIRQHATTDITPESAARAVGHDTARIKRAYREAYGRTVCRGIQEARLKEVQKLLKNTRIPVDQVGTMCGFGNGLYLKALFKRRFGMTMREYRKHG